MAKSGRGRWGLGALALGFASIGCSAADVSTGSEGSAANLSRCFGADCGARPQSLPAEESEALPCDEDAGPLEDRLTFEPIAEDAYPDALTAQQAPDGSVWSIQRLTPRDRANITYYLAHHASDGSLLGTAEVAAEAEHTLIDVALALDVLGTINVAIYSIYAENADSDLEEHLTLFSFDSELEPIGSPTAFRGIATPHLVGGPLGSIWLAGNAAGNATHGAISRITAGQPEWIQTALMTSGQSVGGVSGLSVADDGFAAVVAQLRGKWSGSGPDFSKLGISTFDEAGRPLWSLTLPAQYTSGYSGGIGGTAAGDLIVAGIVGEQGDQLLLQAVSRDGALGWSYLLDGALGPGIEVRRESGRTFAGARGGVAVIDAAGESCRVFSIPSATESPSGPWQPDAEYVLAVGGELTRLRVPE